MSIKERTSWFGKFEKVRELSPGEKRNVGYIFEDSPKGILPAHVNVQVADGRILDVIISKFGFETTKIQLVENDINTTLVKSVDIFGRTSEIIWESS